MKLTATSAPLYSVDGQRALKASAAHTIADTTTLAEVEDAARAFHGTTEIDYERKKAGHRPTTATVPTAADSLPQLDRLASEAARRGIDYITVRGAAEVLGAMDPTTTARLRTLLATHRANSYDPPLIPTAHANPPT